MSLNTGQGSTGTRTSSRRQRLVLYRLLERFEGKLTTSKYAKLAKCSQNTALRDILPLVEQGILVRNQECGRNSSYPLAGDPASAKPER